MDATTPDDKELRERALARIQQRRGFFTHLGSYVLVNAILWIIWAVNDAAADSGIPWPAWVTLFWGIGVVWHAWNTFGRNEITEADVSREMDKMRAGS